MKLLTKTIFFLVLSFNLFALTSEEKIIIESNLSKIDELNFEAKSNINSLNLKKAKSLLDKISSSVNNVKKAVSNDVIPASYFCVIDSMFDGQFAGRGATILEGKNAAITTCFTGSRDEGKSCDRSSLQCEREN